MKRLLVCFLLVGSIVAMAQNIPEGPNQTDGNGLRQGKWTVWFDKNWAPTEIKDSVSFYRVIEYKNDKPVGVVKDHYRSGIVQMEATLLADRPEDVVDYTMPLHYFNADGTEDLLSSLRAPMDYYTTRGKYGLALPYAEKLVTAVRNRLGNQHPDYATSLFYLATLFDRMDSYAKAEPLHLEAVEIYGKVLGKEHPSYANALNGLALHYNDLGKYSQSEPLYLEAVRISEKVHGGAHPDFATYLENLAYMYNRMGNYDKAEPMFLEVKNIRANALGKEHPAYATSLASLASIYLFRGEYAKAEPLYQEATEIRARVQGEEHPAYAAALSSLASIYADLGKYAKAEPLQLKAKEIRERVVGKESSDYALSVGSLASLYASMGNYAKAEPLYLETAQIMERMLGKEHPGYTITLNQLASLYRMMGDNTKAERLYLHVNQYSFTQIEKYFPALSEFEKDAFYKAAQGRFERFNSFCVDRQPQNPAIANEMYNNQLATKALLLNSSSKWKQRIRSSGDKKLFTLYSDWEDNQARLAKLYKEPKPVDRKQIDSLENLTNAMEKELSRRSEMFASLTEKRRATWLDIKAKLKPDEVAVEIIRLKKFGVQKIMTDSSDYRLPRYPKYGLTDTIQYAVLIVTQTSTSPDLVVLGNGNELETKYFNFYSHSIAAHSEDRESYNQFWKPIAHRLKQVVRKQPRGGLTLYISPDGIYNKINLNTLLNPETGKYLLDEVRIIQVTNTKDMLALAKEEAFNNLAYLFGYPDYGVSVEDRSKLVKKERDSQPLYYAFNLERGTNLSDLPGTKAEVESIARLMTAQGWQPEVLTGNRALEETLKDCFKPRVLHIATHGYFQPDGNNSGNSLLRSGLMLTGAGQTLAGNKDDKTEDGILTAYEAMNLNLDNTDLVVLSACETGLGEVRNGEGVYGLQRAFKVAGAKTIIMSLWKVSDEATQELMTVFYENWLKNGKKRESFALAQQRIKAKYKTPYYWGAFVMVGE